jgi:magnesium transporter
MQFELTREYFDHLRTDIELGDAEAVTRALDELYPADIAEVINELDLHEAKFVYNLLDKDTAADVLVEMEEEVRERFLASLSTEQIAREIDNLETDDAADVIAELPESRQEEVLSQLEDIEQADEIKSLLEYDEDTAGGLMGKELIKVNIGWKVLRCVREMRRQAEDIDAVYTIYVVDDEDKLQGKLSLKKLLLASTQSSVADIYDPDIQSVTTDMPSKEVATFMQKYDLVAIPVVDYRGHLQGRITIDDVVDVIKEESEKDFQLLSGISEDVESGDSVWLLTRARLPWLMVGLFGGILGSKVISNYEPQIQIHPEMAIFMPLIAAMGGNVGVQSSAIVVQSLANKSMGDDNIAPRLLKELAVALVNGAICSSLVFAYNILFSDSLALSITVSIALITVICFAAIFGTVVPLILHRYKVNPAVATGPFITTTNDILGLFIYFTVGRILYGMF